MTQWDRPEHKAKVRSRSRVLQCVNGKRYINNVVDTFFSLLITINIWYMNSIEMSLLLLGYR